MRFESKFRSNKSTSELLPPNYSKAGLRVTMRGPKPHSSQKALYHPSAKIRSPQIPTPEARFAAL